MPKGINLYPPGTCESRRTTAIQKRIHSLLEDRRVYGDKLQVSTVLIEFERAEGRQYVFHVHLGTNDYTTGGTAMELIRYPIVLTDKYFAAVEWEIADEADKAKKVEIAKRQYSICHIDIANLEQFGLNRLVRNSCGYWLKFDRTLTEDELVIAARFIERALDSTNQFPGNFSFADSLDNAYGQLGTAS